MAGIEEAESLESKSVTEVSSWLEDEGFPVDVCDAFNGKLVHVVS